MNDIPELPPRVPRVRPLPDGGLESVVAGGRRLLWRRGATALTSTALVAIALLAVGPTARQDSLEGVAQDPRPSTSASASPGAPADPSASPSPDVEPGPSGSAAPDASTAPGASPPAPTTAPEPPPPGGPPADGRPGYREQTDEDAEGPAGCRSTKVTPGAAGCAYTDDSGPVLRRGGQVRAFVGYCSGPETLPTTYEFDGGQETELVVTLEGREVFRFSDTVRYLDGPHTRRERPGRCIEWTNAWSGVTTEGEPVPAGTYRLTFSLRYDRSRIDGVEPSDEQQRPGGNTHSVDVTVVD